MLVVLDGEGYFWDYGSKCDDCGIKQLTEQLAADEELGLEAEDIVVAATHAHSAPDFIGGWGFVPDWYMEQVADTIKATVRDAVDSMRPAVLEHGERTARPFNRERRRHVPLRRGAAARRGCARTCPASGADGGPRRRPRSRRSAPTPRTRPRSARTAARRIRTGPACSRRASRTASAAIGLHFMTGLGNMSAAGLDHVDDPNDATGADDLAALVAGIGAGDPIEEPDIRTARTTWTQPVTNAPLGALGGAGFFDRQFSQSPSTVRTGKDPDKFQCSSTSPLSAEVAASAARIGEEVALTAAPGEIFSNFSNTVKEQSRATVTMPLGQANDALGYMPQSFELNQVGQQGLGFVGELQGFMFVNYEDSYAIDKCFGDMALETSIGMLNRLAGP